VLEELWPKLWWSRVLDSVLRREEEGDGVWCLLKDDEWSVGLCEVCNYGFKGMCGDLECFKNDF